MQSNELKRVQDDIDLIKAAMGSEYPYDRRHVLLQLVVAGAGAIVTLGAVDEWRPLVRVAVCAYAVVMVTAWFWQVRQIKAEQSARPRAWNWTRRETWASISAIGLLIPYVVMTRIIADRRDQWDVLAWRDYVAGPVMFFVGVAVFSIGITARELRCCLGWGVAATTAGLVVPWCQTIGQTYLVLGAAVLLGGLASAVILSRQIGAEASR
jgi:hypothetical protein